MNFVLVIQVEQYYPHLPCPLPVKSSLPYSTSSISSRPLNVWIDRTLTTDLSRFLPEGFITSTAKCPTPRGAPCVNWNQRKSSAIKNISRSMNSLALYYSMAADGTSLITFLTTPRLMLHQVRPCSYSYSHSNKLRHSSSGVSGLHGSLAILEPLFACVAREHQKPEKKTMGQLSLLYCSPQAQISTTPQFDSLSIVADTF
ncbi:uncharacterized protein B0T23DRAFT_386253 [Neurospora hispaniola]|uniref:Uncharacterized protein n=1 Tax=Neurospora hispaniola TaxID=588809 RepID=A0AAJ0I1F5_9PEZI|nr:hypothetical protein B0T23DRAFT_386253 [Neurospora hispaniola]